VDFKAMYAIGGQVIIPTAHFSDNPLFRQKWSKVV